MVVTDNTMSNMMSLHTGVIFLFFCGLQQVTQVEYLIVKGNQRILWDETAVSEPWRKAVLP